MNPEVEFLDLGDLLRLSELVLGATPAIRDIGLLAAAVARPQTTVGGDDAYPSLWAKAAALLQSLLKNHALVDGNKRLAWLATAVFLELNGVDTSGAGNDDVVETVVAVAGGAFEVDEIAIMLEALV